MSEFANHHEQSPETLRFEQASRYLQERLASAGSLNELILSMQDDYSENDASKGQLYQLLHIARFVSRSTLPEKDISPKVVHSLYAGQLIGMTVVDYMTSHENNIPSTILGDVYRRMFASWEEYTHGFDFSPTSNDPEIVHNRIWPPLNDQYAMHHDVAMSVLEPAAEYAELPRNSELKALIDSLLSGISSMNVLAIERGFWIIMREWQNPGYMDGSTTTTEVIRLASPFEVPDHVLEGLVTTAKLSLALNNRPESTILADLEADFANTDFEMDIEEWNRQSLHHEVKDIAYQAARLKVTGQSFFTTTNPEQLKEAAEKAEQDLNTYVRETFEYDEDDVFYAYGTFVGVADTDNGEVLYQLFNETDYRAVTQEYDDREYVNYEVHGTFKRVCYTKAISDSDSYSLDIDDAEAMDRVEIKNDTPAIQLEGVSVINMNSGKAVDYFKTLTIPLTHTHLKLGRFVPPLADEDDKFEA